MARNGEAWQGMGSIGRNEEAWEEILWHGRGMLWHGRGWGSMGGEGEAWEGMEKHRGDGEVGSMGENGEAWEGTRKHVWGRGSMKWGTQG